MRRGPRLALAALGVAVLVVVAFVAGRASSGSASEGPGEGSVDVGFLRDMIDHHDQAVLMSSLALRADQGASQPVRDAAAGVIASQRYEIGLMEQTLRSWDLERGAPTRDAMGWMANGRGHGMGHGTPVGEMPGMASPASIQELTAARGPAFDELFFELMSEHHEGGIHMGTEAAERAEDADVRWLAGQMARNQRREIREMESVRLRLEAERGP